MVIVAPSTQTFHDFWNVRGLIDVYIFLCDSQIYLSQAMLKAYYERKRKHNRAYMQAFEISLDYENCHISFNEHTKVLFMSWLNNDTFWKCLWGTLSLIFLY